ncbi:hypothetical protein D0Y65_036772 [Glycine soja]|uniref:Uncharacterized protein n=1 Tax=Glycine soja TaxID=3848 RepID=A0A445HGD3_GLYSO|nr:hypothetical protein D0Y65_036772 [Glycine soja]
MVSPLCHCVAPPLLYSCVGVNVKGVNPHSHFCLCHVATSKASSSNSSRPTLELPLVSPFSMGSQSGSTRLSLEPPSVIPSSRVASI